MDAALWASAMPQPDWCSALYSTGYFSDPAYKLSTATVSCTFLFFFFPAFHSSLWNATLWHCTDLVYFQYTQASHSTMDKTWSSPTAQLWPTSFIDHYFLFSFNPLFPLEVAALVRGRVNLESFPSCGLQHGEELCVPCLHCELRREREPPWKPLFWHGGAGTRRMMQIAWCLYPTSNMEGSIQCLPLWFCKLCSVPKDQKIPSKTTNLSKHYRKVLL